MGTITVWPGTSINVGPVIDENFPLASTTDNIFDSSWTLGGFNSPQVDDLLLTPDPFPAPIAATVTPTEGASFTGTVASFKDPDTSDGASDYTATINWGDGTPTTNGTTVDDGGGAFHVTGTHTYAEEGSNPVTVTVQDKDTTNVTSTARSSANVADAALHATPRQNSATTDSPPVPLLLWPNPPGSGVLATFTDDDPAGTLADYSATIHWGDGTDTSGTVTTNAAGTGYQVSGSHTYGATGFYTMTVDISDAGGYQTSARTRLLTYTFSPTGGNFVISSKALGASPVTFWSSDWAHQNGLTNTLAFKGYANTPANASAVNCTSARNWSTSNGGNSPVPPATVPAFMSVLVSPTVTPVGSGYSGAASKIVVVHTNAGYAPSPGHPGTGTIVAAICG